MKKVVIAGGTGFIGKMLCSHYKSRAFDVVVLTRGLSFTENEIRFIHWNAKALGPWQNELDGAQILINMNGRSVDCRYNETNRKEILDSRVDATKVLGLAIAKLKNPPLLWFNSSSATIYRHAEDRQMDEITGEIGKGFSVEVCKSWEHTFFSAETPETRKVALRTAIVLGAQGGALKPLLRMTQFGLGGSQGNGSQFFSWIHEDDLLHAMDFIEERKSIEGPVNISAPNPLRNEELMRILRQKIGIPFGIPTPKWLLAMGAALINTETELILKSRNVVPKKLNDAGFVFKYPSLNIALDQLIS